MKKYKYKTVKIPIKFDKIYDDTDLISNIKNITSTIASFLDSKDLNNQINQFAKDGWKLIHCEKNYDIESKIIGSKKVIVDEYDRETIEGYKGCEKIPDGYTMKRYKTNSLYYYLCIFEKEIK
ncbi:hypothetical protein OAP22_00440 [Candidatus Pelagibacter ubique]|nr:hypothetical protein [Candidatus Pelagibacter ubique]